VDRAQWLYQGAGIGTPVVIHYSKAAVPPPPKTEPIANKNREPETLLEQFVSDRLVQIELGDGQ